MPLQTGTWTACVGGLPVAFVVNGVNPEGIVTVTLSGTAGQGFWEEVSQSLHFLCIGADGTATQRVVAYLFPDSINLTGVAGTVIYTLAGYVEAFSGGRGFGPIPTAKQSVFAWYAQIGID